MVIILFYFCLTSYQDWPT